MGELEVLHSENERLVDAYRAAIRALGIILPHAESWEQEALCSMIKKVIAGQPAELVCVWHMERSDGRPFWYSESPCTIERCPENAFDPTAWKDPLCPGCGRRIEVKR